MSNTAEIKVDGKSIELPVIEGTENEQAIDIGKLRAQSGIITIDPGYKNTGATKSAITFFWVFFVVILCHELIPIG